MCLIFFELMSIITICVFAGGGHAAGVLHEQRSVGRVRRPDDSAGAAVDRQHSAPAAQGGQYYVSVKMKLMGIAKNVALSEYHVN